MRLGYRTLSSSSMKGASPIKDENRADQPSSPEHHTKIPAPTKSPRSGAQTRFGFSPRTNTGSFHRDSSAEVEPLSSNESLDGRYASPPPTHRGDAVSHQPEDAPSVSSGYNSDDITSGHTENPSRAASAAGPSGSGVPAGGAPAGQKYDPRQYQDQQNDFHPVSKQNMVRKQIKIGPQCVLDDHSFFSVGSLTTVSLPLSRRSDVTKHRKHKLIESSFICFTF